MSKIEKYIEECNSHLKYFENALIRLLTLENTETLSIAEDLRVKLRNGITFAMADAKKIMILLQYAADSNNQEMSDIAEAEYPRLRVARVELIAKVEEAFGNTQETKTFN